MDHSYQDAVSLALALRIAEGLPSHPEWLDHARANLDRWSRQNGGAPSLVRCDEEWRQLLKKPLSEIRAILGARTDEGQRLRQNSPFTGILAPAEVWAIKARQRNLTPENATSAA